MRACQTGFFGRRAALIAGPPWRKTFDDITFIKLSSRSQKVASRRLENTGAENVSPLQALLSAGLHLNDLTIACFSPHIADATLGRSRYSFASTPSLPPLALSEDRHPPPLCWLPSHALPLPRRSVSLCCSVADVSVLY